MQLDNNTLGWIGASVISLMAACIVWLDLRKSD